MGKINQGILGGFSGKVGNVVGFFWKGEAIMRSLAGNPTNPRTEAQLEQRARFTVAGSLLSSIYATASSLFTDSYSRSSVGKSTTKVNKLMRNILNSLQSSAVPATSADDWQVDFAALNISEPRYDGGGTIPVTGLNASYVSGTTSIDLTWNDNSSTQPGAASTDIVQIVAFPSTRDNATGKYIPLGVAMNDGDFTRRDQAGSITVPATWAGQTAEVYVIVHSADDSNRTESVYVGSVTIS